MSFDEFDTVSYDEWKEAATAALKGGSFEKQLFTKTYEGITLQPIYRHEDAVRAGHRKELPGGPDYGRGTRASGYLASPWVASQVADGVLPERVNRVLLRELAKGDQGVNIAFAESVLRGEEPAAAEYAGNRLLVASLDGLKLALNGVDLASVPLQLYGGASAAPLLGMLAGVSKGQTAGLHGCVGGDPIGALASDGELSRPLDELFDEMALAIHWAREKAPNLKTVLVRGEVYNDGGANAVQEVAYALATAVAYLDAMAIRGIDAQSAATQIRFGFSMGANFFMEIAKLRSARMLWAQIVAAYGGDADAQKMDIFARTSHFTETVFDPYVNILRATTQTFAAVVGGVDTFQVAPFDEVIEASDEQSRRVARNIHLMFKEEFDLTHPVDPVGGAWYVENLAAELADKTWACFQSVQAGGGIVAQLTEGVPQAAVAQVLADRFKALAQRRDRAVGNNMYANMAETPIERDRPDPAKVAAVWEERRAARAAQVDAAALSTALERVPAAVSGDPTKFIPAITAAFEVGATLQQLRVVLDDGFEGTVSVTAIPRVRWTDQFEALRNRTLAYEAASGDTVKVFLANMGPIPQHKARADFTTGFMEVAHFNVLKNDGFPTVEAAAEAAVAAGADVAVICSTDATYPELVPPLAKLLKDKCPGMLVLLAGAPAPELEETYRTSGVDDFIHVRANNLEMLTLIQDRKGI